MPQRLRIIYLAHPLGAVEPQRTANIARAMRWYQHLFRHHPGIAVQASWILSAQVAEETQEERGRGVAMDNALLPLCDEVWLCGDHVSPGMLAEARLAVSRGIQVRSILRAGGEPPVTHVEPVVWSEAP